MVNVWFNLNKLLTESHINLNWGRDEDAVGASCKQSLHLIEIIFSIRIISFFLETFLRNLVNIPLSVHCSTSNSFPESNFNFTLFPENVVNACPGMVTHYNSAWNFIMSTRPRICIRF